jgi:hypothetical protein
MQAAAMAKSRSPDQANHAPASPHTLFAQVTSLPESVRLGTLSKTRPLVVDLLWHLPAA